MCFEVDTGETVLVKHGKIVTVSSLKGAYFCFGVRIIKRWVRMVVVVIVIQYSLDIATDLRHQG